MAGGGIAVVTASRADCSLRVWELLRGSATLVPLSIRPRCLLKVSDALVIGHDEGVLALSLVTGLSEDPQSRTSADPVSHARPDTEQRVRCADGPGTACHDVPKRRRWASRPPALFVSEASYAQRRRVVSRCMCDSFSGLRTAYSPLMRPSSMRTAMTVSISPLSWRISAG